MRGYPKSFKPMLYGVAVMVFTSGLLLTPTMLDMRLEWDVPWRLPFEARTGVVMAHFAAAMWLLMIFGAAWTVHMRLGWRTKRNLVSGLTLVAAMLVMALTSVGIYYFGDEDMSLLASVIHTVLGLLAPVVLLYHISFGKMRAEREAMRARFAVRRKL
ncbi:hypothetical protein [Kordiimonas aestuarii]|uniref:hypothetical protein n=1 Tax=Kordiimonas aestuarii TaxID=1005925 RepID=UPI0021CFF2AB|nr:hypothetical protein [Kordiimonas aestuarii]